MLISRRAFFSGLAASLAAPAIIRTPGILMPVRTWLDLDPVPEFMPLPSGTYDMIVSDYTEVERRLLAILVSETSPVTMRKFSIVAHIHEPFKLPQGYA